MAVVAPPKLLIGIITSDRGITEGLMSVGAMKLGNIIIPKPIFTKNMDDLIDIDPRSPVIVMMGNIKSSRRRCCRVWVGKTKPNTAGFRYSLVIGESMNWQGMMAAIVEFAISDDCVGDVCDMVMKQFNEPKPIPVVQVTATVAPKPKVKQAIVTAPEPAQPKTTVAAKSALAAVAPPSAAPGTALVNMSTLSDAEKEMVAWMDVGYKAKDASRPNPYPKGGLKKAISVWLSVRGGAKGRSDYAAKLVAPPPPAAKAAAKAASSGAQATASKN